MVQFFSLEEFAQAARPTLLDAASKPELLISLIYANLMSPSLWDLMRKLRERSIEIADKGEIHRTSVFMTEIHDYVDKKFCHLAPLDIIENVGLVDIEEERKRLSEAVVDEAIESIMNALHSLEETGRLKPKQNIFNIVEQGQFPEFDYSTIDVIEALGCDIHRKHRPLGVTICADEAALIASLAIAEGCIGLGDVAILGSPVHYTLFVDHAHQRFWFNGKHEYHDSRSWRKLMQGLSQKRIQTAFDSRIFNFDRVITPLGIHLLRHGRSSLSADQMRTVYNALKEYFGIEVQQIAEARNNLVFEESLTLGTPDVDFNACKEAGQFEKRIRVLAAENPYSIYELALYSFRSIRVPNPEAYIQASLRGYKVRDEAKGVRGLDDAIQIAANLSGNSSIFNSFERIALPDELLHFKTGSHREVALLLYCLLHLSPKNSERKREDMEIQFSEEASYLRVGETYIDAATLKQCKQVNRPLISMCEEGHSG